MAHSRKYAVQGSTTVSASVTVAMINLTSTAAIEPSIFYLAIGSTASPADVALEWLIGRSTTAGTAGAAVTPQNLGPGTTASTATAGRGVFTTEPTLTSGAVLWRLALNQRAAHSLVFDPEGCPTAPATAANGLALYLATNSGVPTVSGCIYFRE